MHRRGAQDRAHRYAKMHKNASAYAFLGFFGDFRGILQLCHFLGTEKGGLKLSRFI